jgi:hypothetical protein
MSNTSYHTPADKDLPKTYKNQILEMARSERFELPTLGIEIRCSIQLSYERVRPADYQTWPGRASRGMSRALSVLIKSEPIML